MQFLLMESIQNENPVISLVLLAVLIVGGIFLLRSSSKKAAEAEAAEAAPVGAVAPAKTVDPKTPAPGTAGELKLYDLSDKTAAIIMAIVAHKTGKPLNELRFRSIREIKE